MSRCRESVESRGVVVLGIGNVLLSDEGVGVHALRRLSRAIGALPGVKCIDGGTLGITLAADVEDCDALVVLDASETGQAPGSVMVFEGESMDRFLGACSKRSAHEIGLLDLMAAAALGRGLPRRRALIGIQAECFAWGLEPTERVQAGIATACERARELVERWR
jgi:hydrogenase maturation protease